MLKAGKETMAAYLKWLIPVIYFASFFFSNTIWYVTMLPEHMILVYGCRNVMMKNGHHKDIKHYLSVYRVPTHFHQQNVHTFL